MKKQGELTRSIKRRSPGGGSIMYGIGSDYAANNNGIGNCKTLVAQ